MFRLIAVLAVCFAGLSCAQDLKTTDPAPETAQRKRLVSVTWDLSRHRLVWVVEKGTLDGDRFRVVSSDKYEISPEEAVMEFRNEKRGFAEDEALGLSQLLNLLSVYCAESVEWWEDGQGVKAEPKGEKVRKQDRREPRPDEMVARLNLVVHPIHPF